MHSTLRSLAYLPSAENFDSIRRHVLLLRGKVLHNDTVILCTSGEVNSGCAVGKSIKTAGNCVYAAKIFSRFTGRLNSLGY